jgi:hypothetical protein
VARSARKPWTYLLQSLRFTGHVSGMEPAALALRAYSSGL